jgi:hypothetical protein
MKDAKGSGDVAVPVTVLEVEKPRPDADLAREIIKKLERDPGDRVTCVRVFDDFYRCNWWAVGAGLGEARMEGLIVSAYRVRKSQFVRARLTEGRLVLEDATRAAPN